MQALRARYALVCRAAAGEPAAFAAIIQHDLDQSITDVFWPQIVIDKPTNPVPPGEILRGSDATQFADTIGLTDAVMVLVRYLDAMQQMAPAGALDIDQGGRYAMRSLRARSARGDRAGAVLEMDTNVMEDRLILERSDCTATLLSERRESLGVFDTMRGRVEHLVGGSWMIDALHIAHYLRLWPILDLAGASDHMSLWARRRYASSLAGELDIALPIPRGVTLTPRN